MNPNSLMLIRSNGFHQTGLTKVAELRQLTLGKVLKRITDCKIVELGKCELGNASSDAVLNMVHVAVFSAHSCHWFQ